MRYSHGQWIDNEDGFGETEAEAPAVEQDGGLPMTPVDGEEKPKRTRGKAKADPRADRGDQ